MLRRTLSELTALAAAGAQDVASAQEAIKRDKATLDRCLKVREGATGEGRVGGLERTFALLTVLLAGL